MQSQRFPLLLIELLLACTLVLLAAGVIALTASSLLREQRFLNDLDSIRKTIQLTSTLAAIADIDFLITFSQDKKGWRYQITTEELLPDHYVPLLDANQSLSTIGTITWSGEHAIVHDDRTIVLSVRSRGSVMSQGILTITDYTTTTTRYLCLEGIGLPTLFTALNSCHQKLDERIYQRTALSDWIAEKLSQEPAQGLL